MKMSPEFEQHSKHVYLGRLISRAMDVQPHTPVHKLIDSIINWSDRPGLRREYDTMTNEMIKDKFEKWLTIHEKPGISG